MMTEEGNDARRIRQQLRVTQEEFAHAVDDGVDREALGERSRGPEPTCSQAIEIIVQSRRIGPAAAGAPALGAY